MSKGITLSEKHGVNPGITQCFYCGEDSGLILYGKLKGDAEAPKRVVADYRPCTKCEELMKQGVFLIEVRDGESGDNPYRTGRQWVITEEAVARIFEGAAQQSALKRRCAFIDQQTANLIGLPAVDKPPAKG